MSEIYRNIYNAAAIWNSIDCCDFIGSVHSVGVPRPTITRMKVIFSDPQYIALITILFSGLAI